MGPSQRMVMMPAAQCRLMVFFPNRTIARTESENAAKLPGLATDLTPNSQTYNLHRYRGGLGCSEASTTRTADVTAMKTDTNTTTSPDSRRLMRKRRSGRGIERAIASATAVIPITTPAASTITVIKME